MVFLVAIMSMLGPVNESADTASPQLPGGGGGGPCPLPEPFIFLDPIGDAVIRRTDLFADGLVDPVAHHLPDIFAYRTGNWQPDAPDLDLYLGCWDPAGNFIRFDVAFFGLVNPPGLWALSGIEYNPFLFGDHPVFGYITFDVDNNPNSGGELVVAPFRHLSNVARFGGVPAGPRFFNRVARGGEEIDDLFLTPPFIERSGEEFHIALFGDLFDPGCTSVFELVGNGDCLFDEFETWEISAPMFHRAHGYEPFSGAGGDGRYEPRVDVRFESRFGGLDITLVSLIYPLTNIAAAQALGDPAGVEPPDGLDDNQNSIAEALLDLVDSVAAIPPGDPLRNDPTFALIAPWETQDPFNHLNTNIWDVTLIVSTTYIDQDPLGDVFVWTDTAPGPKPGDFDGSGIVNIHDVILFDDYILTNDGLGGMDDDGVVDGIVILPSFGHNFSVYDLNYDGSVDASDRLGIVIRGDMDGDFDIDLVDAAILTDVLLNPANFPLLLFRADVNEDGAANGRDIQVFVQRLLTTP
ncbi:MAG: dockerin type I domain-containing protein [Phycisphaerae bacterium]